MNLGVVAVMEDAVKISYLPSAFTTRSRAGAGSVHPRRASPGRRGHALPSGTPTEATDAVISGSARPPETSLTIVTPAAIAVSAAAAVGERIAGHVEYAHHDGRLCVQERTHRRRMRSKASARDAELVWNRPRTAEVVVLAPGLRMPRMAIHRCSASTTTIAPRGSSLRMIASAT